MLTVDKNQNKEQTENARTAEFLGLFAKHQRTIALYLTSLLPTQTDVDDVFQETSLALWREFESFEIGTNFGAWACTVAFNRVRAWRSRRSRESLVFSDAFLQAVSDEMIKHSEHYRDRSEALQQCIRALPEHHRELIRHRYDAGCSIDEIAEQAERSSVAIYRMLSRVRHALHDCISARIQLDT